MDAPEHDLFRWTDGTIVLFAERNAGGCTVARGWLAQDRMSDVRRWHFSDRRKTVGQIRRLVHEATGDHLTANAEAERMAGWLSGQPTPVSAV